LVPLSVLELSVAGGAGAGVTGVFAPVFVASDTGVVAACACALAAAAPFVTGIVTLYC